MSYYKAQADKFNIGQLPNGQFAIAEISIDEAQDWKVKHQPTLLQSESKLSSGDVCLIFLVEDSSDHPKETGIQTNYRLLRVK